MKHFITTLISMFALTACGGQSLKPVVAKTQGKRAAVVSLSINDFGGSLQGWNSMHTSELMGNTSFTLLENVERSMAKYWQVVPVPTFVGNPAYLAMGNPFEVAVPRFTTGAMPVIARDRNALIGARLSPDQAQALARIIGVDILVVVYSEWGVMTGSFMTSKALTKNVVSIYDASGLELYHRRQDSGGRRTLGAFGKVVVDENSISEWSNAFKEALEHMFNN